MTAVWRGERGIGPAPRQDGRPGLLIGGRTDIAYQRPATYADGWTIGGGTPAMITQALGKLTEAWTAAGRVDRPRTAAMTHLISSVFHRLIGSGWRCRQLGPISVVPYPVAASLKTVRNHVSRILDKLQAAARTQAVLRAGA